MWASDTVKVLCLYTFLRLADQICRLVDKRLSLNKMAAIAFEVQRKTSISYQTVTKKKECPTRLLSQYRVPARAEARGDE